MRSLYLVAGTTMAGVSSVFALLAEIHNEYGIAERSSAHSLLSYGFLGMQIEGMAGY